jgi:peptide/nickel transport system permease protein
MSIGGLFSDEFVEAPWSLAKVGPDQAPPAARPHPGLAGTAQLIRIMRANLLDEPGSPT